MIAARTDDFKHFDARMFDGERMLAHGGGRAGDFCCRLSLGALRRECGEVGGILSRTRFAAHDFVHYAVSFFVGQIVLVDDLLDGFFYHGIALLFCWTCPCGMGAAGVFFSILCG